jgi:hypothetical protein
VERGREVILEGGKQPGEERPAEGVNNVDDGERIRPSETLQGAVLHRKVLHSKMQEVVGSGWLASRERWLRPLISSNPRSRDAARWETAWRTTQHEKAAWRGRGETSEGRVPKGVPA